MKKCKEQLKKQYSQPDISSPIFDVGFKTGWKAALECVRDEMLPSCYEPMDIYDFIEEELTC